MNKEDLLKKEILKQLNEAYVGARNLSIDEIYNKCKNVLSEDNIKSVRNKLNKQIGSIK